MKTLIETLRETERAYWAEVMAVANGNIVHACKIAGCHRSTLYKRTKALKEPLPMVGRRVPGRYGRIGNWGDAR